MHDCDALSVEVPYPSAYDVIVCPVCGCRDWTMQLGEGTYCEGCNLEVSLGPTNGDPGFVATFNADTCWPDHWDKAPDEANLIPEDPEKGRTAYAKFMRVGEGDYGMYWIAVYAYQHARHNDDFELSEMEENWRPAWERSEYDGPAQEQWSPFHGQVTSDDEEASPADSSVEVAVADDGE